MATYLKRASKLFDLSVSRSSADVNLRDLMCPVCRGILIEPVTLPCTHNLCLRCLKGTFEHNSLSCPLCRLRVGSWLRTATKSETLVNQGLWELIRAKFPKEVEDKHNGEERNLNLVDTDFTADRILSAAGEIHREYEAQLQMAEEEMRRQRQAEQMASEALIQKLQAEEQQQLLTQLAQDQLFAKTLAKKQVAEKRKEMAKYYECLNTSASSYAVDAVKFNVKIPYVHSAETSQVEAAHSENRRTSLPESIRDSSELKHANMALLSKIRAERFCRTKANVPIAYKDCCPKQLAVHNTMMRSLKHQTVSKFVQPCTSGYSVDPGCSTSRTYITETKEELRVPSDVVNSKKKSLGIEICMTHGSLGSYHIDDDERIGSAESSGSHDSINQEIHHFKPIKTVPRTSLKVSSDGKQIDPKLIRVIPIVKRVINAVLKPPSPTHVKRNIGCSWSAFRGKARQNAREKQATHASQASIDTNTVMPINQKPSTSLNYLQTVPNKPSKHQNDTRLDFVPESSIDDNKNYTKNISKIVNGTKLSKKLSPDNELDSRNTRRSWRTRMVKNGIVAKSKRYRGDSKKGIEFILGTTKDEQENNSGGLSFDKSSSQNDEQDSNDNMAVENIAERIKRRKVNAEKKASMTETESNVISQRNAKRNAKKRIFSERKNVSLDMVSSFQESAKSDRKFASKQVKRQKVREFSQDDMESSVKIEQPSNTTNSKTAVVSGLKKSIHNSNSTKIPSSRNGNESDGVRDGYSGSRFNYDSPPESCDETEECTLEENNAVGKRHELSDEEMIEEQQRIERLLLQEREDFELARRLQAKFNEMEWIAGRTRRSRRVIEDVAADVTNLRGIGATRMVRKTNGASRATKASAVVRTSNTVPKRKRGRPSKRMKQDEMRAR